MAQRSYRATLSNAQYPFRLRNIGESVMMSGIDASSNQKYVTGDSLKASVGIPQLVHAINLIPTLNGYSSAKSVARHTEGATLADTDIISPNYVDMYDSDGLRLKVFLYGEYVSADAYYPGLFFVTPTGYSLKRYLSQSTTQTASTIQDGALTAGMAQGSQFLYTEWSGLCVLLGSVADGDLRILNNADMYGIEVSNIKGIVVAAGFIVAYSDWAAAWSTALDLLPATWAASTEYSVSTTAWPTTVTTAGIMYRCTTAGTSGTSEPSWNTTVGATTTDGSVTWQCQRLAVDFEPSTTTGAGGGNIEELRGPILCCKEVSSGFIAYTANNCVYCGYTGNYNDPFTFKNISGSSGVINRGCVTGSSSGSMHYVVGRSGVQQVTALGTKTICDPLSEILQDTEVDRYSLTYSSTDEGYIQTKSTISTLVTQIQFIADRYICVLRGTDAESVSDIYIYDTILERYGKFDCGCLTVFTCTVDADTYAGQGGSCLGVIDQTGNRFAILLDDMADTSTMTSLALFGPYKFIRDQWIDLQEIHLSAIDKDALVVPIPLGPNGEQLYAAPAATWVDGVDNMRSRWMTSVTGDSILIAVIGRFNLSSLSLTFTSGGHM